MNKSKARRLAKHKGRADKPRPIDHKKVLVTAAAVFVMMVLLRLAVHFLSKPVEPDTTSADIANGQAMMKQLVQSHPDSAISHTLDSLILNKVIMVSYQAVPFSDDRAIASFQLVNVKNYGITPVLCVDIRELESPTKSNRYKQLIIYHEYVHYQQYASGRVSPGAFIGRRTDIPLSEEEVCDVFENESEAYLAESKLALRLGWSNEMDICQVYARDGLTGMRRRMAEYYASLTQYKFHRSLLFKLADSPPRFL